MRFRMTSYYDRSWGPFHVLARFFLSSQGQLWLTVTQSLQLWNLQHVLKECSRCWFNNAEHSHGVDTAAKKSISVAWLMQSSGFDPSLCSNQLLPGCKIFVVQHILCFRHWKLCIVVWASSGKLSQFFTADVFALVPWIRIATPDCAFSKFIFVYLMSFYLKFLICFCLDRFEVLKKFLSWLMKCRQPWLVPNPLNRRLIFFLIILGKKKTKPREIRQFNGYSTALIFPMCQACTCGWLLVADPAQH